MKAPTYLNSVLKQNYRQNVHVKHGFPNLTNGRASEFNFLYLTS